MDEKDLGKDVRKDGEEKKITYEVDLKDPIVINEARAAYTVDRLYTYDDYLNWSEDERIEIIDGKIYYMCAPTEKHQALLMRLSLRFGNYLHGKICRVYVAPFEVRFDFTTVVLPDLVVTCNTEYLDERGLKGAPDLVIEILSESTAGRDKIVKYNKYLSVEVKEYWIIDPIQEEVMVNLLSSGRYTAQTYVKGDVIKVSVLADLYVNVTDLFEGYQGVEIVEVEMAREEEREKAETEKLDIVKNLMSSGVSIDIIADSTQLSKTEVLKLKSE